MRLLVLHGMHTLGCGTRNQGDLVSALECGIHILPPRNAYVCLNSEISFTFTPHSLYVSLHCRHTTGTHILAKVASKTGPLGSDTARHARTRNRDDAENSQSHQGNKSQPACWVFMTSSVPSECSQLTSKPTCSTGAFDLKWDSMLLNTHDCIRCVCVCVL